MSEAAYAEHDTDTRMIDRMLFFSDAVFAIVLTLLVLELRPPVGETEAELAEGLRELGVHFIAFGISFALGGVFWLAHMRTLRTLQKFDWWTAAANLVHLMAVAMAPFASAMLGEHIGSTVAFEVYSWLIVAIAFTGTLTWLVASRDGGRLFGGVTARNRIAVALRTSAIGWCFLISIAALAFDSQWIARFSWVLMAPLMVISGLIAGKPAPATSPAAQASAERAA